jgi:multimeric flavodoxin WrbA
MTMQVCGISGSMRRDGNTAILVKRILDRCSRAAIDTEYISLSDKEIRPCLGCEKCKEQSQCVVEDDDWQEVADKIIDCEVLVIGSPTYYYDVSGHTKNFIDRTYSLYHNRLLAGRRAVVVAVNADSGAARAAETIEGFLNAHEFSFLGSVIGKGYLAGDILQDASALREADNIADRIIRLLAPGD